MKGTWDPLLWLLVPGAWGGEGLGAVPWSRGPLGLLSQGAELSCVPRGKGLQVGGGPGDGQSPRAPPACPQEVGGAGMWGHWAGSAQGGAEALVGDRVGLVAPPTSPSGVWGPWAWCPSGLRCPGLSPTGAPSGLAQGQVLLPGGGFGSSWPSCPGAGGLPGRGPGPVPILVVWVEGFRASGGLCLEPQGQGPAVRTPSLTAVALTLLGWLQEPKDLTPSWAGSLGGEAEGEAVWMAGGWSPAVQLHLGGPAG